MWSYYFLTVLSFLVFAEAATTKGKTLPSYITACSKSSPELNKCATEHGRQAIPSLLKGDKKYQVPVLLPYRIEKLEVTSGPNFQVIFSNLDLYGLDKLKLDAVKVDPEKKHVEALLSGSGIKINADYKVNGQILVLPVKGEGTAEMRYDDGHFHYSMDYELIKRDDGREYARIKNSDVKFKVNKAHFQFDNLFNGDKLLGNNINQVLNDNPQEVLEELGGAISATIKSTANSILNGFLGHIAYDDILLP